MASTCAHCDVSLMGKRYVLRKEMPTCLGCYENKFANKCEKCKTAITTEHKDLSYGDKHWHEFCFLCASCGSSLANKQFVAKDTGLVCAGCVEKKFSSKCHQCNVTFKHGSKKVEYNGKEYHEACFCCAQCKKTIGENSFIPKESGNGFLCMNCYNEHYAKKCAGCLKRLGPHGVNYRGKPYHSHCFVCCECETELGDTKFATKDDKPYCQICYVKMFSKTCIACERPISGLGTSAKFCSFEGKNWHAECFRCTKCRKSLVGKGFLIDDDEVVCSACADPYL